MHAPGGVNKGRFPPLAAVLKICLRHENPPGCVKLSKPIPLKPWRALQDSNLRPSA